MYEVFEQLLERFGITAYQFSKETGISQSTISTWKKKRNLISGELATKIAQYFKVSVDYLMTGEEKEGGETYYLNDETREIAQEIFENPDLKSLFHMSRKMPPDRLKAHIAFMKNLYDSENGNNDKSDI